MPRKMELQQEIPILVLRKRKCLLVLRERKKTAMYSTFVDGGLLISVGVNLPIFVEDGFPPYLCGGQSPYIYMTSGFNLMVERQEYQDLSKPNFQKNFEELVKKQFVEGRIGLRALFDIKLNNVLETNVAYDI